MLSDKQKDAITEIVNIGVGKGSATLSQMLDEQILLNVPYVNLISFDEVLDELGHLGEDMVNAVELKFYGEYQGMANVILSTDSANHLVSVLTREPIESDSISNLKEGVITEVGNIILNGVMGSFGNILNTALDYHIPKTFEGNIEELYQNLDKNLFKQILICRTDFSIEGKNIKGEILIMYEINSFKKLKSILDTMID